MYVSVQSLPGVRETLQPEVWRVKVLGEVNTLTSAQMVVFLICFMCTGILLHISYALRICLAPEEARRWSYS